MIRINLVRYGRRKKIRSFWMRISVYISYIFLLLILAVFSGSLIDEFTGSYEKDLIIKRSNLKRTIKMVKKGSVLKKNYKNKTERVNEIRNLKKKNVDCMNFITDVAQASAASSIRLSSFSINEDSVEIEGFSFNTREISLFLEKLKNNNWVKTAGLKVVDKNSPEGYPKLRFLVICTRNS